MWDRQTKDKLQLNIQQLNAGGGEWRGESKLPSRDKNWNKNIIRAKKIAFTTT